MDLRKGNEAGARNSMVIVKAKAHAALVQGDTVALICDSAGLLTVAIPAAGSVMVPGVALDAIASGAVGEFCIEGVCDIRLIVGAGTVGHGIVADNSSAGANDIAGAFAGYPGDSALTHFAVALETSAGAGLCLCYMHGYPITSAV